MMKSVLTSTEPDCGTVTIEAAIVLCALMTFLVLGISALGATATYVHCIDAAREIARLSARGDERGADILAHCGLTNARFVVHRDGDEISVEVVATPYGSFLPGLQLRASAYAIAEPDPLSTDSADE